MSENKRQKLDPDAASSSASVNIEEMASTSMQVGGEGDIVQQTAGGGCDQNKKEEIFDPSSQDFGEAVEWTGFVDKTLLIEELLSRDEPKCVIIVAPSRFGKSLNMDMVKRFFEIEPCRRNNVSKPPQDLKELEKYDNYQVFLRYGQTPKCKILNNVEFVKEYFGRHPVVYLDFKIVDTNSPEILQNSLRDLVRKAYLEHDYLQCVEIFSNPISNQNANETCKIWCNPREYLKKDPKIGLQTLIEYLHAYHKRKVYFLVDEFDAPATEALLSGKSGDDVREISNQVTKLIASIVKGEIANKHLLGSLITGVSYLSGIGISAYLNNVPIYKWLLNDRFAPYYGLQDDELKLLLEHVFPNDKDLQESVHSEVKDLYNGYFFKGKCIYSFWSVLHYIDRCSSSEHSEIKEFSFWGRSSMITEMFRLLKDANIRKKIIELIKGGHVSFTPCHTVSAQKLADFLQYKTCDESTLFSFFMEQGYLTHIQNQENENENKSTNEKEGVPKDAQIFAKIPNRDVLFAFERMFVRFCGIFRLSESVMTSCGAIFKHLRKHRKDPEKCKQLIKELRIKLKELLSALQGMKGINEAAIQAALFVTMFKAGFRDCRCEHRIHNKDGKFGIIDFYMRVDDYAIIFEIKYVRNGGKATQKSARRALKEIIGKSTKTVAYTNILDGENKANYYLLAGLAVNRECEPYMCCLFNNCIIDNCFNVGPENYCLFLQQN